MVPLTIQHLSDLILHVGCNKRIDPIIANMGDQLVVDLNVIVFFKYVSI